MKKIFLILLVFMIVFTSNYKNVSAIGVDTGARVLSKTPYAEKVFSAIGERVGIKYVSQSAKDKAFEKWNMDLYKKIEDAEAYGRQAEADELRRFEKLLTETPAPTPTKTNPNVGQLLVDSALFVTGADLIVDSVEGIMDSNKHNRYVERLTDLEKMLEDNEAFLSLQGYSIKEEDVTDRFRIVVGNSGYEHRLAITYLAYKYHPATYYITDVQPDPTDSGRVLVYSVVDYSDGGLGNFHEEYTTRLRKNAIPVDYNVVNWLPSDFTIPEIQTPNWLEIWEQNKIDNPDEVSLPEGMPEQIPIRYPIEEEVNYPIVEEIPLNTPIIDVSDPYTPVLPDGSPDTISEPYENPNAEPNPDSGTGTDPTLWDWLKNLIQQIINILNAILNGVLSILEWLKNLIVPSEPIGPQFEPFLNEVEQKFNSPSDFAYLTEPFKDGGMCEQVKDKYITLFGKEMKVFDASFIVTYSSWWKPILSGFFWFMFGFWAFRRMNMMASKNGGATW